MSERSRTFRRLTLLRWGAGKLTWVGKPDTVMDQLVLARPSILTPFIPVQAVGLVLRVSNRRCMDVVRRMTR